MTLAEVIKYLESLPYDKDIEVSIVDTSFESEERLKPEIGEDGRLEIWEHW